MPITYLLAPEPFWVIINNEGTVAGGAKMYTRSSLNRDVDKIVYQDAGGTIPWTNPIVFDLNGVQGPFYWAVDSSDLDDSYYIFVNDSDGNLIWDIDDFAPPGSGGGGNVTTYLPLTNYITNNQFIDHIPDTSNPGTNLVIAPSNHKGFTPAQNVPIVGTWGVVGPDIRFLKDSTANTDTITFPLFPLGTSPLTGDVTPVDYVRYVCTTSIPGETFKCFQFPITQKIKNLENKAVTLNFWAAVTSGTDTMTAWVRQYFGSGTAASPEFRDQIGSPINLTTTWTLQNLHFVVPSVAGKSIGTPGFQTDDDALYIQLQVPLNVACDILFTKPALYLGTINPNEDFENYDQINSVNSTARTGDIKTSLISSLAPTAAIPTLNGWVPMNDGSIGNIGSGATTRANKDTFQLYKTIWDGIINTWAPVSTGRGATAVADFLAGKTLTLPRSLGRALAGAGAGSGLTTRALGEFLGSQTNTIVKTNLPDPISNNLGVASVVNGPGVTVFLNNNNLGSGILANPGGNQPINNMQPTSFMNVYIKL